MIDYNSRLEISYYSQIAAINEAHQIYLVQHIETQKVYIKKVLHVYNLSVYQQIKTNPIPGLPIIYCLYEQDNELTIIEEYISGNTLLELIDANGCFSEDATARIVIELCDILIALHKHNPPIIHRDIKPSNVIITPAGQVKLLDLNAARADTTKDEDTVLLGTKGYAAPEQYGFGSSNIQTDIYAIGILMNTLLCGAYSHEIVKNRRFEPIIRKCTEINPKDRYRSVAQLKDKLVHGSDYSAKYSNSWKRFLPPGFRTTTIWHMIIAIPVYLFIGFACLFIEVKDTYGFALWVVRLISLIMFLSIIACFTNYLDIQRIMPLCSKKNLFVRIFGIIVLSSGIALALFWLMVVFLFLFST